MHIVRNFAAVIFVVCVTAADQKQPGFLSREGVHYGMRGHDVTLPCRVSNLGDSDSTLTWQKEPDNALFAERHKITDDDRFSYITGSDGNFDPEIWDIKITNVDIHDYGTYVCRVTSDPEIVQKQILQIKSPATVNIIPEKSPYVVNFGGTAQLECHTSGNPLPKTVWTKINGLLPDDNATDERRTLIFERVSKKHEGIYRCTADNGVGTPVSAEVELQINYPDASSHAPRVSITEKLLSIRVSESFNVSCTYSANPKPTVEWLFNGYPIDHTKTKDRMKVVTISMEHSSVSTVIVNDATMNDFGDYKCRVMNNLGEQEANVMVTGVPGQISELGVDFSNDATILKWKVESVEPLIAFDVSYRKMGHEIFQFLRVPAADAKTRKVSGSRTEYEAEYLVNNLEPGSKYEILLKAENKYGWGPPVASSFLTSEKLSMSGKSENLTDGTSAASLAALPIVLCFTFILSCCSW